MKQIFILEKEELADLRRGEPLKIVLGDQTITLQADVVKKIPAQNGNGKIRFHAAPGGGVTTTARVLEFLETHGPASVSEISKALGVSGVSVRSPLIRGLNSIYKKSGRRGNQVWRVK